MKPVLTFLLIALFVSACGGDSNGTTADPRQGTPGGSGKWSSQEMQTQTDSCVARGSTNYSADVWRKYCSCVFVVAAGKWTYQEYKQDTYNKIMTLYQEGTVTKCADQAGIRYQ